MTYVMGGPKDDVNKRPQKPHKKKRPLSAVIEEFEADDVISRNNNNGDEKRVINHNDVSEVNDSCKSVQEVTEPNQLSNSIDSESDKDTDSNQSSISGIPRLILPPPESKLVEEATKDINTNNINTPRRSSLKTGRRQALTAPSFSPKLSHRGLTSRLKRDASSESEEDNDDVVTSSPSPSDMTRLRQTADRLHLSTRRPSVMQWRAQYVECPQFPLPPGGNDGSCGDVATGQHGGEGDVWTAERTERINTALDWILNELQEMRTQDQQLARQLLTIRSDLHQLKLARSCEEHQDMLDDVQSDLEELQEFADVLDLDLPVPTITDSPLKHLGVTRMNLSARRFSTC